MPLRQPYLRLDPGNNRFSLPCGCFTERWRDGTVAFFHCDRHAEEMLALEDRPWSQNPLPPA